MDSIPHWLGAAVGGRRGPRPGRWKELLAESGALLPDGCRREGFAVAAGDGAAGVPFGARCRLGILLSDEDLLEYRGLRLRNALP